MRLGAVWYSRIYAEAIDQQRSKVFNNEIGVKAAIDTLTPVAINIIRSARQVHATVRAPPSTPCCG
jgi:hypothetical protein